MGTHCPENLLESRLHPRRSSSKIHTRAPSSSVLPEGGGGGHQPVLRTDSRGSRPYVIQLGGGRHLRQEKCGAKGTPAMRGQPFSLRAHLPGAGAAIPTAAEAEARPRGPGDAPQDPPPLRHVPGVRPPATTPPGPLLRLALLCHLLVAMLLLLAVEAAH